MREKRCTRLVCDEVMASLSHKNFLSTRHRDRGSTLFESLIALLLSSLLFILVSDGILRVMKAEGDIKSRYQALQVHSIVKSEIGKVMRDFDQHSFPVGLMIHKNGDVRMYNGVVHAISRINSTSRPRPGSDAISGLQMSYRDAQYVKRNGARLEMCALFGTKPSQIPVSYLGFTTHEMYQAVVETGKVNSAGCREVQIRILGSLFVPSIDSSLVKFTSLLVPVYSEYTIYTDASGQLRYVGHIGNFIRENQPILRGIRNIRFSIEGFGIPGAETLSLLSEVWLTGGQRFEFERESFLARHAAIELQSLRVR